MQEVKQLGFCSCVSCEHTLLHIFCKFSVHLIVLFILFTTHYIHLLTCRRSVETYIAFVLNLLCLSVYLLDVILNVIFLSWRGFWTYEEQNWNRVQFVFLCFFTIDWILLLAQIASGSNNVSSLRHSSLTHTSLELIGAIPYVLVLCVPNPSLVDCLFLLIQ